MSNEWHHRLVAQIEKGFTARPESMLSCRNDVETDYREAPALREPMLIYTGSEEAADYLKGVIRTW